MGDLVKSRKSIQGSIPKSWKNAKNDILQEKSKKLGNRSRMYFAVFDGFRRNLMLFIDQNMRFHGFSMLSVKNPRILSQILFKTRDFGVKSKKNEKLLRNDPKVGFLCKFIILG